MSIPLQCEDRLYYCVTDVCVEDNTPSSLPAAHVKVITHAARLYKLRHPTTEAKQLEGELWDARLGISLNGSFRKLPPMPMVSQRP